MSMREVQGSAPELPSEVWATVFALLQLSFVEAAEPSTLHHQLSLTLTYSYYQALRLVCKRFNKVFEEHAGLSACVLLRHNLSPYSLPSLVRFLRHSNSAVQTLLSLPGSPYTEAALICISANSLTSVAIHKPSFCSVNILSCYSSLTSCSFHDPSDEAIIIDVLHTLPNLHKLSLTGGMFYNVDELAHLKEFSADMACVRNFKDCIFVSSLERLSLTDSTLDMLNHDGLAACKSLRSLLCNACLIQIALSDDEDMYSNINQGATTLPFDLSILTQLTQLSLGIRSDSAQEFGMEWVYALINLKSLNLEVNAGIEYAELSSSLRVLRELESLTLNFPVDEVDVTLKLDVAWGLIKSLQHLECHAEMLALDWNILSLTTLQNLRTVDFQKCIPDSVHSNNVWKALLHNLHSHSATFLHSYGWKTDVELLLMSHGVNSLAQ